MTNIENEFWEGMNGIFPDIIKAITSLSIKYYNHNVNNPRNRSSEFLFYMQSHPFSHA